jgi:hypothetical protein
MHFRDVANIDRRETDIRNGGILRPYDALHDLL